MVHGEGSGLEGLESLSLNHDCTLPGVTRPPHNALAPRAPCP
jgi:hypothetical protein